MDYLRLFKQVYRECNEVTVEWSAKMKELKNALKADINKCKIEIIEFTEENVKALGESIHSPIEVVNLVDNNNGESLYHKLTRKKKERGGVDRKLLIGAIKPTISSPLFIIEHKVSEAEKIEQMRKFHTEANDIHLYFKPCEINGSLYVIMAVISLGFNIPLMISIYDIDDIFREIKEEDTILYENGQQVKEKILRTAPKP